MKSRPYRLTYRDSDTMDRTECDITDARHTEQSRAPSSALVNEKINTKLPQAQFREFLLSAKIRSISPQENIRNR